jgi:hypothetical protein
VGSSSSSSTFIIATFRTVTMETGKHAPRKKRNFIRQREAAVLMLLVVGIVVVVRWVLTLDERI